MTTTPVTTSPASWRVLAWQHLGLLVTTAVFIFVVLRVLLVARMNTETALAVFATSGAFEVGLGILVSSYSAFLLLLFVAADVRRRVAKSEGRTRKPAARSELVVGLLIAVFAPWLTALLFMGFVGLNNMVDNRLKKNHPELVTPVQTGFTFAIIIVVASFVAGPEVWLPAEVVATNDAEPTIGYVLASESDWTSVLLDDERYVVRLRSESVTSRVVCTPYERPPYPALVQFYLQSISAPTTFVPCDMLAAT